MRRLLLPLALGTVLATSAVSTRALPAPEAPAWVVAGTSGDVEVSLQGARWQRAELEMTLVEGDRVRTGQRGRLFLRHDRSQLAVRGRTEVVLASLAGGLSQLDLLRGSVAVETRALEVLLATPAAAEVRARDAGLVVGMEADDCVGVAVQRGLAVVTSSQGAESVLAGLAARACPAPLVAVGTRP